MIHHCETLQQGFAVASGESAVVDCLLGNFLYMRAQYKSPREICLLFEVEQFITTQTQQITKCTWISQNVFN